MAVWRYDVFVREAFQESKDFQMAQKQAFEGCVNKDTRTAQYLSLYIDDLFRKGLKGPQLLFSCFFPLSQVHLIFSLIFI